MLESLSIRNFQKHKKLEIKLDPKITTIQGPNDAGKSAILRALRWVLFNRPIGRAFIRHGAGFAKVTLHLDGNRSIGRKSGRSGNLYTLADKRYKAFRNDVPQAVVQALQVSDLNIQRQHDPSFWFSLTPGQVAKELNKIVDLETIDRLQAAVGKRLKKQKAELAVCQKRLKEAEQIVTELSWVESAHVKLDNLGKLANHAVESPHLARLRALTIQRGEYRAALAGTTAGAKLAIAAGAAGERLRGILARITQLGGIVSEMRGMQQQATIDIPSVHELEMLRTRIKVNKLTRESLADLILKLKQERKNKCKSQKKVRRKQKLLEEKLGGRCPTCGGILTLNPPVNQSQ